MLQNIDIICIFSIVAFGLIALEPSSLAMDIKATSSSQCRKRLEDVHKKRKIGEKDTKKGSTLLHGIALTEFLAPVFTLEIIFRFLQRFLQNLVVNEPRFFWYHLTYCDRIDVF